MIEGTGRGREPRRSSAALVVALIAVFATLGGAAYAASKIGTKQIRSGAVTAKKLHRAAVRGGKIADGAVREDKLESTLEPRWAVVNDDGTLARGRNVASTRQVAGVGIYDVTFDSDVRNCSYVATVGRPDDVVGLGGFPIVNRDPTDPNGVRVFIADKTGLGPTFLPRPFHLQVEC